VKPDEAQILLDQSRLALEKGDFEEAHTLVDRVLKAQIDFPEALNLKALIFFREKKYREARELFFELSRKFPGEPALILNLGISALKLESWQEALEYLHRAQELMPNNPKIHNYLGLAYSGIGQFKRAQEEFIKGGSKKMADQMLALLRTEPESSPSPPSLKDEFSLNLYEEQKESESKKLEKVEVEGGDFESVIDKAFTPAPSSSDKQEPTPSPQDLLGQALKLLRKRYEPFEETGETSNGLKELSQRIALREEWQRPVGFLESNLLGIELHPQRFTAVRLCHLLGWKGDLTTTPLHKRYKGKDLKALFGSPEDPLFQCQGSGEVFLLAPQNQQFFSIKLERDLLYIREEFLFGIVGALEWENGRLPSPHPPEPQVVQVRGEGHAILIHPRKGSLRIITITGGKNSIHLPHLVGWFGQVIPLVQEWGKDPKILLVQFQGEGVAIVYLPHPD
jgi:tetratricopeptide (TPR) repeat protein